MASIGWHFPSSGGGTEAGFNDSGIETFAGNPFENLAREIIQNSLDARDSLTDPVVVSFEVVQIPAADFPGHAEMLAVMKKCVQASKGDEKASKFFNKAVKILRSSSINCLKISDYNTTGLCDGGKGDYKSGQWHRLVKTTGRSGSDKTATAGGSYGIGKNAPFAVSDFRTVFYYTYYKDGKTTVERMQGKAILISHELEQPDDYSQAVGFFGIKKNCEKLTGTDVAQSDVGGLKRTDGKHGTTLLIPGLAETAKWREKIEAAVVSNFFHAIHKKQLEVLIDNDTVLINSENLSKILSDPAIRAVNEEAKTALYYYQAMTEGDDFERKNPGLPDNQNERKFEITLPTLGHCILWLKQEEKYPQNVAILRRGMKITDRQKGLIQRWGTCSDFAAVCICDSDVGNALLRKMENPEHNAFEPERLGEDVRRGKKALKELVDWVRGIIKAQTQIGGGKIIDLDKLSKFFPSPGEGALPGEERDFEGKSEIDYKPIKMSPPSPPDIDESENGEDGEDGGEIRGENDGTGGDRAGKGGAGGDSKTVRGKSLEIKAARVIPIGKDVKRVMFTPKQSGEGVLFLEIAGDSYTEKIAVDGAGKDATKFVRDKIKDGGVILSVKKDERVSLAVKLKEPVESSLSVIFVETKK